MNNIAIEIFKMAAISLGADVVKDAVARRVFPNQAAPGFGPGGPAVGPGGHPAAPHGEPARALSVEEQLDQRLILEPNIDPETRRGVIALLVHGTPEEQDRAALELLTDGFPTSARLLTLRAREVRDHFAKEAEMQKRLAQEAEHAEAAKRARLQAEKKRVAEMGASRIREAAAQKIVPAAPEKPVESAAAEASGGPLEVAEAQAALTPAAPAIQPQIHPADAHVADLLSDDPERRKIDDIDAELKFVKNLPRARSEEVDFRQTVTRHDPAVDAPLTNGHAHAAVESPTIDAVSDGSVIQ